MDPPGDTSGEAVRHQGHTSVLETEVGGTDQYHTPTSVSNSTEQRRYKTAQVAKAMGVSDDEIRILMIGKTGSGKSATCNTILNKTGYFATGTSMKSITKQCLRGETKRFGKKLMVVDTPGLFDTEMTNEDVTKEITRFIGITSPGFHAIVLVVPIVKFTAEENNTVMHFVQVFGEAMFKHLIVLFTKIDELPEHKSIHQYLTDAPAYFNQILENCKRRYTAFSNKQPDTSKENHCKNLVDLLDRLVCENEGSYYTNKMYIEAEKVFTKRMKEMKEQMGKDYEEKEAAYFRDLAREECEKEDKSVFLPLKTFITETLKLAKTFIATKTCDGSKTSEK